MSRQRTTNVVGGFVAAIAATWLCSGTSITAAEEPIVAPPSVSSEKMTQPESESVHERAVPRRDLLDAPAVQKPTAKPPSGGGTAIQGQAIMQAAAAPIGPPDPVAPVKEVPIHLLITNLRDAQGNNIGVRGQVDRVVALVNANMAQQTSVRAKLRVESFNVYAPSMSATTDTDRPNERFVRIPYIVGFKIYDVDKKVGGAWVSTGVTRHLSQSIGIHMFCDRWQTGKGSLKLTTKIDRPYMEPNQGTAEQIVDFFLNGHLTDFIDSIVRQQIAAIPITNGSTSLNLDCNTLGRNAGDPNTPTDDLVLYSYHQSTFPDLKGETVLGQLSLTLRSIKRLAAHNLQGQPLYAVTETPHLEVFANQYTTSTQLPALQEGQQVAINAPPITMPTSGLASLSVLVNVRQPNLTQVDSATQVFGQNVNYGSGTRTIRVKKSYWTQANPQTGAKPQQVLVDAYELTFAIQGPGGLVADPTVGPAPTTGTVKPDILNQAIGGMTIQKRGIEGDAPRTEDLQKESGPEAQETAPPAP